MQPMGETVIGPNRVACTIANNVSAQGIGLSMANISLTRGPACVYPHHMDILGYREGHTPLTSIYMYRR